MAPPKCWGATMVIGRAQERVIARATLADFQAQTGIARAYISQTSNARELALLDEVPPNTVLVVRRAEAYPLPPRYIRHPSAQAKAAGKKPPQAEQRITTPHNGLPSPDTPIGRIAQMLYAWDRHNTAWECAPEDTQAIYTGRARAILDSLSLPLSPTPMGQGRP